MISSKSLAFFFIPVKFTAHVCTFLTNTLIYTHTVFLLTALQCNHSLMLATQTFTFRGRCKCLAQGHLSTVVWPKYLIFRDLLSQSVVLNL